MSNNKSITVAILNQGGIRPELVSTLINMPEQNKYNLNYLYPMDKPITHNRNKIVKDFKEQTTDDYLLMIDGDNVPPINVLNLADFQKDIIGGLCFAWKQDNIIPLVLKKNKPGETYTNTAGQEVAKNPDAYSLMDVYEGQGLVECDAIGTGVMMIARHILTDPRMKFPFKNKYDEEGVKHKGLDIYFCEKAKELGYEVWCHTGYKCDHWAQLNIKTVWKAINNLNDKKEVSTTKNANKESDK